MVLSISVPLVLFAASAVVTASKKDDAYAGIFKASGIVPDVVPFFQGAALELQFSGLSGPVLVGTGLSANQVAEEPAFFFPKATSREQQQEYVVIMVDSDAPTPQDPFYANVRHLVAPNMKINEFGKLINSTPALWDYVSPAPPVGSAPHRYTVLLYHQPPGFVQNAAENINDTSYAAWSLSNFTSLTGLKEPVAGTFFLASTNDTAMHTISGVDAAFETAGIVSDLIPSLFGSALLDMSYPKTTGNSTLIPNVGAKLTVAQVADEPEYLLTYETVNDNASFVLFLLDPDAPTPQNPSVANVLHLLAHGLQPAGKLNRYAPLQNSTPALAEYYPPSPPAGSDLHRYTALLYAEPAGFAKKAKGLIPAGRYPFNLTDFVMKTGLGAPLAGNFFYSGQNLTI